MLDIRRIRTEGQNGNGSQRRREDWVCHEVWSRDGQWILYHGTYAGEDETGQPQSGNRSGRSFVGRVAVDGGDPIEVAFPSGFRRYGHFTLGKDDRTLVSVTTIGRVARTLERGTGGYGRALDTLTRPVDAH